MEDSNLIVTLSGIRGIVSKDCNFKIIKKIAIAYGLWFKNDEKRIIIGRDTRPSSMHIEQALIEGLVSTGFKILNLGICPKPVIIYTKNKLDIPGGIIITGSHNPQEWNGLKLLSTKTFLDNKDLEIIANHVNNVDLNSYKIDFQELKKNVVNLNPIPEYIQELYHHIDFKEVKRNNNLRVVIDTGAGAGKFVTPQILGDLGCDTKLINNELLINKTFPREIDPIKENLTDIMMEVWQGNYDIGFAHDSAADRLVIIGENGEWYPEDIGLALITEYYLKKQESLKQEIYFVTNLASSLRFDAIAEKYNAHVIRTPIGEKFLTHEMDKLISGSSKNKLVFGGEGSCGGVMYPNFNNTRDGIFAAAKLVEILVETGEKVSKLVAKLPKYYSHRINVDIKNVNIENIIKKLKTELITEGEEVEKINNDLRFGQGKEWFVLIHPSTTEPVIRIISEAKRKSLVRIYCEATAELVKLIIG
ncbi:MAG: hypothetical protein ACFFC3_01070 [Candidatus Odinarchaeota archaeon]